METSGISFSPWLRRLHERLAAGHLAGADPSREHKSGERSRAGPLSSQPRHALSDAPRLPRATVEFCGIICREGFLRPGFAVKPGQYRVGAGNSSDNPPLIEAVTIG